MKKNMKINPQLLSRIMGLMAKFGLLPKHLNSIFNDMYGQDAEVNKFSTEKYGLDLPTESHYSEKKGIDIGQLHDSIGKEMKLDKVFGLNKKISSQNDDASNSLDQGGVSSVVNSSHHWKTPQAHESPL